MEEFSFSVTEYDPDRPWIVVSREQRSVELEDGADFFEWAHREWPTPRYSVELAPWELSGRDPV